LLYDADKIKAVASAEDKNLVRSQLSIYLDPNDPEVISAAKANGIAQSTLEAAQNSPVYKFVKKWGLALPLHPEFRTIPNLFYVPPLLPIMASVENGVYETTSESFWGTIDKSRLPMKYLANLFSAGDEDVIKNVLKKMVAVRLHRRNETVGDLPEDEVKTSMEEVLLDKETADEIFRLTSLPLYDDRFVIPPAHREEAMEMLESTADKKGNTGFGFTERPKRGL